MSYFQARLAEVQTPPKKPQKYLFHVPRTEKGDGFCFFLIKMNYEKQQQSGGKDEQFRLFVLFVLRKAL